MFISVNGKARKVVEVFAGGTDGKAHKVKELFGSVNGIARLLFTSTKATTGFDAFTWAEIKQLANEGKLLEHFNLYDKVTVKLKTPLEANLNLHISSESTTMPISQKQTEMQLKIIELTETKMRLTTPRANVFGLVNDDLFSSSSTSKLAFWISKYKITGYHDSAYYTAKAQLANVWGMTPMYDKLKIIQNSLPDDLVSVLSVCTKPVISYEKTSMTDETPIITYDEDMRVRQLSTYKIVKSLDESDPNITYPVITESYFPTTVGDYLYYLTLPEEYDTYENRKYLVKNNFGGYKLPNYTDAEDAYGNPSYKQTAIYTPRASCYYRDGFASTSEISTFNSDTYPSTSKYSSLTKSTLVFPEMIIEADATE